MPYVNDLKEMVKVWITAHRPQFLVLVAIAVCLALIIIIMTVLIKTRPKPSKEIPELGKARNRGHDT